MPQNQHRTQGFRPDIRIISLSVRVEAVDAIVMAPAGLLVTERAAERAIAAFPKLASHICVAADHQRFGEEIVGTEPAHLVEHVAIELMVQTAAMADNSDRRLAATPSLGASGGRVTPSGRLVPVAAGERTFIGHTSRAQSLPDDDPDAEVYQVSVTYDNDLVAIAALRYACAIVAWILCADSDAEQGIPSSTPVFTGIIKDLLVLHRT